MAQRPCKESRCIYPASPGIQRCGWHNLARQPIAAQIAAAHRRLALKQAAVGFVHQSRVPASRWPVGGRFCSGCQSCVPSWYCTGSRCKACASEAARAGHVQRTYGLDPAEEQALLAWQDGRCFVCGRKAVTRRLAVDHDHDSGEPRGLLCSDDKFGCNVLLRRILGDPAAAARLVLYVTAWPLQRMRNGEPGPFVRAELPDDSVIPF